MNDPLPLPPRAAGVQLHPTSLPGGRLGPEAFAFADWLERAGQSVWQTLPLGPPDRARSPYKSRSAFAAWPGLLADPDAAVSPGEEDDFLERHGFWVRDWMALAGGRRALRDQVRFDREWAALRRHAADRGVRMFGDVPIYVAPGSVDHRAHPELFQAGAVAGAPPDSYSRDGQLWGNPLYRWPALRSRRYHWWTERLRRTRELFDLARIDHFRGFVAYWSVPEGARNAAGGRWRRGPGRAVFDAAARELGPLALVAEDLGRITPAVTALRDGLRLPGMVVLQFGFDPHDAEGPHRLEHHRERSVVYSATHDTDTLRGWWASAGDPERDLARRQVSELLGAGAARRMEAGPEWPLIRLSLSSRARLAMTQAQDILGLGSEARMNTPGTPRGNWSWALRAGQLGAREARRLREATAEAGRLP